MRKLRTASGAVAVQVAWKDAGRVAILGHAYRWLGFGTPAIRPCRIW